LKYYLKTSDASPIVELQQNNWSCIFSNEVPANINGFLSIPLALNGIPALSNLVPFNLICARLDTKSIGQIQ
jgi:hypothetical protein